MSCFGQKGIHLSELLSTDFQCQLGHSLSLKNKEQKLVIGNKSARMWLARFLLENVSRQRLSFLFFQREVDFYKKGYLMTTLKLTFYFWLIVSTLMMSFYRRFLYSTFFELWKLHSKTKSFKRVRMKQFFEKIILYVGNVRGQILSCICVNFDSNFPGPVCVDSKRNAKV